MKKSKTKQKDWHILVSLPNEVKDQVGEVAKKRDWSFRQVVRHAVEEYVAKELGA